MKRLIGTLAVLAVAALIPALACGEDKVASACPFGAMKGVEKTTANMDNGVKIVWASKDAELLKSVQESLMAECEGKCADCAANVLHAKGVEHKVESSDNAVVLILTASDPDLVKQAQAFGKNQAGCKRGKCPMSKKAKA